jgi:hypothetical protein
MSDSSESANSASQDSLNAGASGTTLPTPAEVRAELDRVLRHPLFHNSARLSALLRFVVETTLTGRSEELKESVVGVEVFEKDPSYSTRDDPVVRVMSGRLRGKLAEYYQGDGRSDPIIIEFPRGGYVPSFRLGNSPQGLKPKTPVPRVYAPSRMAVVVLICIVAAVAFAWYAIKAARPTNVTGKWTARMEWPGETYWLELDLVVSGNQIIGRADFFDAPPANATPAEDRKHRFGRSQLMDGKIARNRISFHTKLFPDYAQMDFAGDISRDKIELTGRYKDFVQRGIAYRTGR